MKAITAGSAGEAVAGAGAIVLGILGLCGVYPFYMSAIATICAGAALFIEGSAIVSQYKDLEQEIGSSTKTHVALGAGMSFEVTGGLAGIALGILALIGIVPVTLNACAAIAMGGALFLGAGAVERLDKIRMHWYSANDAVHQYAHGGILGAVGLQVLVGLCVVALGIIALVGYVPNTLNLISMISLGGAVLLAGAAVSSKMVVEMKHDQM